MLAGTQKPMLGTKLNRAHPLAEGLRGCWLFNEGCGNKAYDLSGYGNHGTLRGMAFPPTAASGWNPGRRGPAIAFDSLNDDIDCGTDLTITDAITIEAWMKRTSTIANNREIVYLGYSYTPKKGVSLVFLTGTNEVDFRLGNGTDRISISFTLPNFNWHHIVGTWNGTIARLYVDGNEVGTPTNLSAPLQYANSTRRIGQAHSGVSFFNGSMDSVKIYNRALSAEEIKWLYHEPYAMFERGELLL